MYIVVTRFQIDKGIDYCVPFRYVSYKFEGVSCAARLLHFRKGNMLAFSSILSWRETSSFSKDFPFPQAVTLVIQ